MQNSANVTQSMPQAQRITLLQGPVGPFFRYLQDMLLKRNFNCTRINFNKGDELYSSSSLPTINFKGNLDNWSMWFEDYVKENKITLVILFGADRPIHSIARNICKKLEVKVLCLEEGYFRPGYVSVEEGGNNASSPLAGSLPCFDGELMPHDFDKEGASLISQNSFPNKCWYGFTYYFTSETFSSKDQRMLFHKHLNLYDQALGWIRNFFLSHSKSRYDSALFEKLSKKNYYLVALQLDTDIQSRFQSNGWKKTDLL